MLEISIGILFMILLAHWFSDFVCQSRWMAENKSKNIWALLLHAFTYTVIFMACAALFWYNVYDSINISHPGFLKPYVIETFVRFFVIYFVITFCCHFLTDLVTSKITSFYWQKKNYHRFFEVIGLDQMFHYLQLILLYVWLESKFCAAIGFLS